MSLKPFNPTFRQMAWPDCKITEAGNMLLRGMDNFYTFFEAISNQWVDAGSEQALWHLSFYEVLECRRPLPFLDPRSVEVPKGVLLCNFLSCFSALGVSFSNQAPGILRHIFQ